MIILTLKLAAATLAILCGVSDARSLTIPNKYVLGMIILFPIAALIDPSAMPFINHLIAGGIIFGLSFILFSLKLMGGGDSKMAGALALWVGLGGLINFIAIMAMAGGVLAAISLVLKKNKNLIPEKVSNASWFGQLKENKNVVPYGIAIAIGGIFALF